MQTFSSCQRLFLKMLFFIIDESITTHAKRVHLVIYQNPDQVYCAVSRCYIITDVSSKNCCYFIPFGINRIKKEEIGYNEITLRNLVTTSILNVLYLCIACYHNKLNQIICKPRFSFNKYDKICSILYLIDD